MEIRDQLHRSLYFKSVPIRIVSLVPSQSELLCFLGLEESLLGVTKFCVHPKSLKNKSKIVGGTKQVNYNKIKALKPDVILCNKEENTKEMILELEKISPVHVSDIFTLEDCYALINQYGQLFGVEEQSKKLIQSIKKQFLAFNESIYSNKKERIAYFIWKDPWMVAASNTFIDEMIKAAGFTNVFEDKERYPVLNDFKNDLKNVDRIFLSSEPYPFKRKHVEELQILFPEKKIENVDGELFSWYGSRILKSFNYFKTLHM